MKALITGITGQDGSYLAELLLSKGYEVHGIVRRHSVNKTQTSRIDYLRPGIGHNTLHYGDMTDFASLLNIIKNIRPDEIYNLAAQSHVKVSEETPIYTAQADAIGVINLLTILKEYPAKMYQASTSEMFGNCIDSDGFQRETTHMKPVSPYAAAKLYAHNLCNHYRNAYKLPISCGILFNHTSTRRGESFIEQKLAKETIEVKYNKRQLIEIGEVTPSRDFGYAPEYVEAMWLMLQNEPNDFVIATGISTTIDDLRKMIRNITALERPEADYLKICVSKYQRAEELYKLRGDSSKAKYKLGWIPQRKIWQVMEEIVRYWEGTIKST